MEDGFLAFRSEIESEYERKETIRSVVREIEQKVRDMMSQLQKIHTNPAPSHVKEICALSRISLPSLKELLSRLGEYIEPLSYFKYHDLYRVAMQRATFLLLWVAYLEHGELLGLSEVAAELGLTASPQDGLHLDLEDYLHGVLELAKELARLSVNAVTVGDFARPRAAREFLSQLDACFRSLNLKNDGLRRRFDALKYDLKKVEEVVYDLAIRNLAPATDGSHESEAAESATSPSTL